MFVYLNARGAAPPPLVSFFLFLVFWLFLLFSEYFILLFMYPMCIQKGNWWRPVTLFTWTNEELLEIREKILRQNKGFFNDLSSLALLERCLRGDYQNRNEGLHSNLWCHRSKENFSGLSRVQFITQLIIIEQNFG